MLFSVPVSSSIFWPDRADAPQTHHHYTLLDIKSNELWKTEELNLDVYATILRSIS